MRVFTLSPAPPGWTASIKDVKYPILSLAVIEYTVQGPPPYAKMDTVAMISTGKEIVPANLQDGFQSLNPPDEDPGISRRPA